MNEYIQFDTSDNVVGGINIAEAIQSDGKIVFNESYTVVGTKLTASSIYACYDLNVVGDLDVDEIEIRGNLCVVGNIKAKRIICSNSIHCTGNIDADNISSGEIICNDITCTNINSAGNIIARTSIDISESLQSEKSVLTGEGIIGNGSFSALNAVAPEYFDFSGDIKGKIVEVSSGATFGKAEESVTEDSLDEWNKKTRKKIVNELKEAGNVDEDHLLEIVERISNTDEDLLSDWKMLTESLVRLSYVDKITNLRDYLLIIMSTKLLPEEIVGYETLEHVFDQLLVEAEKEIDTLEFHADTLDEFFYSLKIVSFCPDELRIDQEDAFDRIFQSVGIKYKTVKAFLG